MNSKQSPIEHLVVLMLENRSYDHMLGYLGKGARLTGKEFSRIDPSDSGAEKVYVTSTSGYVTLPDSLHDVVSVEKQEYGDTGKVVSTPPMNGFVKVQIENAKGNVETGKKIMQCFDPGMIPALTTLTREFVLCDHWHASVPGPTWLNRFFAHAATCDGIKRDNCKFLRLTFVKRSHTIFSRTWVVY